MFEYGKLADEIGEPESAQYWLTRAARAKHPEAMLALAGLLHRIAPQADYRERQRNLDQCEGHLTKALEYDRTEFEAAYQLARLFRYDRAQYPKAAVLAFFAASNGHSDAAFELAQLKTYDPDECPVLAASQPSPAISGLMTPFGLGTRMGHAPESIAFREGYPVETAYPDEHLAFLYRQASAGGNGNAAIRLALIYLRNLAGGKYHLNWDGKRSEPFGDEAAAEQLLLNARSAKLSTAMVLLARIYLNRSAVADAEEVLREAVALKDPVAASYLGRVLLKGAAAEPPARYASNFARGKVRDIADPRAVESSLQMRSLPRGTV